MGQQELGKAKVAGRQEARAGGQDPPGRIAGGVKTPSTISQTQQPEELSRVEYSW